MPPSLISSPVSSNICYSSSLISVDGNWTAWADWGECSRSCGGGLHSRLRACTNPAPRHGGKDCVGKSDQIRPCNTQSCPGMPPCRAFLPRIFDRAPVAQLVDHVMPCLKSSVRLQPDQHSGSLNNCGECVAFVMTLS